MKMRITYLFLLLLLLAAAPLAAQQNQTQTARKDTFEIFVPSSYNQETEFDVRISNPGNLEWSMDFSIYNRWGEVVWSSQSKQVHWNGTNMKGQALPADTYIFRMKAVTSDGDTIEQTGHISLVR